MIAKNGGLLQSWGALKVVGAILVAGAVGWAFLDDVFTAPKTVLKLEGRLDVVERKQDVLDVGVEHMHRELIEVRKDLRVVQAGRQLDAVGEHPLPGVELE